MIELARFSARLSIQDGAECGKSSIIFPRVILRITIIYGSETFYYLKENELRALERIEEVFIRKLLKTSSGCPISQIDLKTGHVPARFEISKRRCLFLKHILTENSESMIYKIVMYKNQTRGDWLSSCFNDLKYLSIDFKIEQLQSMKKNELKQMLLRSIEKKALQYLLEKR